MDKKSTDVQKKVMLSGLSPRKGQADKKLSKRPVEVKVKMTAYQRLLGFK